MSLNDVPVITSWAVDRDDAFYGHDFSLSQSNPVIFIHPFMLTMLTSDPRDALARNLGELVARAHSDLDKLAKRLGDVLCKHCGRPIKLLGSHGVHLDGGRRGLARCATTPERPYGYNAEPEGQECSTACLGSKPEIEESHRA